MDDPTSQRQNVFRSSIFRPRRSFLAEPYPHRFLRGFPSSHSTTIKQGLSSSLSRPSASPPKRRYSVPTMTLSTSSPVAAPNTVQVNRTVTSATTITEYKSPRSRPLFCISHEVSSDDGHHEYSTGDTHDRSPESSYIMEEASGGESSKDDIRRYHALMELLTTEVGYLMDLRALVTIYLRQLPTLTSRSSVSGSSSSTPFSRTHSPSSAPAASRVNSHTHVHLNAQFPYTALPVEGAPQMQGTGNDRTSPRYLFSDIEVETLTRNAEEILQLHEHFVEELQAAVAPFGFIMAVDESGIGGDLHDHQKKRIEFANVDAAIGVVAAIFATKASRFNSYQSFCSGHPEALDLVRRVQQQYASEWDAFEQYASALIVDIFELSSVDDAQIPSREEQHHRQRTHSLSSMEGRRSLRAQLVMTSTVSKSSVLSEAGLKTRDKSLHRLALMDYMIKPVQRICKYPLLLGQLSSNVHATATSSHRPSNVNIIVESALQAMRHVAGSVDEARRRQGIATQSAIIISRISLASTHYHSSSLHPAHQSLTPTFLASVGACLLAGSLDVVHYPASSTTVKVKYLGAFLYMGGYFVLVKVCKGRVYEPRHWFSLAGFEVIDVEEEDAMLPCSFRLSCRGHCFELAAACQREKETWISSIRESLSLPTTWTNEPSSLQFDGKGEPVPSSLDGGPFDAITSLPTIQSIPELNNTAEAEGQSLATLDTAPAGTTSRRGIVIRTDLPPLPSRRSSTASVKAIFSPMGSDSDTVLIRRSTATTRAHVDSGLQDVISGPCLSARSYASAHEEELFQAPKIVRSGFSRSSSGLSMAGAMGVAAKNRLSRHESLRVPRRKSTMEGYGPSGELDALAVAFTGAVQSTSSRTKSLASRRRTKRLSIISGPKSDGQNVKGNLSVTPSDMLESPTPRSQCSSTTMSSPSSAVASPELDAVPRPASSTGLNDTIQQSGLLHVTPANCRPKRSRSLVDNVKSLFQSSPSEIRRQEQDREKQNHQSSATVSPGLLQRWIRGPNHRRVRSVPDVLKTQHPNNELHEYHLPMSILSNGSKSSLSVQVPIATPEPLVSSKICPTFTQST